MQHTSFGSLIKSLRAQNHMTQADLADIMGVTDKAVSKWERDLSLPDINLFPSLADVFGVTVSDLLRQCTDEEQPSRLLQIFEMSHDIRTPLHIILGCADMAEAHRDDAEAVQRYLQSIRVSGEYLLQVIDRAMKITYMDQEQLAETRLPNSIPDLDDYLHEHISPKKEEIERYDFSGHRVLVAEDMELNREIAYEILVHAGIEVDFADDGKVCLEKLESAPAGYYDLILMDVMMPNMNGIEATKAIRHLKDKKKANIPVIAMTAKVYDNDRKAATEAGMDAFTEKPVFVDKLFETMRQFL